jgi:hypothetical protein
MKLPSTLLATTLLLGSLAFAGQQVHTTSDGKKSVVEPCPPTSRVLFDLDSSYVFGSDIKSNDRDAKGDAYSGSVELGYRIPLGQGWPNTECGLWHLKLGARYTRHDFGHSGGLPLPNHIQTLAGLIALEYVVSDETAVLLETRPGVYFENDIAGRNFDSPTTTAMAFRLSDRFIGMLGATYGSFRAHPILPVIGFKWTISDRMKLTAIYPQKASLDYKFSEACGAYVGGEYVGDSVRVDRQPGRTDRLNHAVLSYSEWRAGAGVKFKLGAISGELGAGYAFQRKFDYHRADLAWETDEGAPYIKAEFHAAF